MADPTLAARNLAGLDELELPREPPRRRTSRAWSSTWPKLAAIVIAVGAWQLVVASHWRPDGILPGPGPVFSDLWRQMHTAVFYEEIGTTMRRAVVGFAAALVIGTVLGLAVSRVGALRSAVGSLITGLQTMPSIAWFPLAILLFAPSEGAILFVVVLGAAPAIANGLISGVDYVPALLLRAGRALGASGLRLYRHVVLPAALPAYVSGLKQGWAFAWRSLLAAELLVAIAHRPSLGLVLQHERNVNDSTGLLATMIVILALGIGVNALFNRVNTVIRQRWGVAGDGG
ncbi:MAG TPA: ABC transporter permease [Mycobacteriales bacterium]|nr:ABC transporter permease [Mycobacteriales bacterium]